MSPSTLPTHPRVVYMVGYTPLDELHDKYLRMPARLFASSFPQLAHFTSPPSCLASLLLNPDHYIFLGQSPNWKGLDRYSHPTPPPNSSPFPLPFPKSRFFFYHLPRSRTSSNWN